MSQVQLSLSLSKKARKKKTKKKTKTKTEDEEDEDEDKDEEEDEEEEEEDEDEDEEDGDQDSLYEERRACVLLEGLLALAEHFPAGAGSLGVGRDGARGLADRVHLESFNLFIFILKLKK